MLQWGKGIEWILKFIGESTNLNDNMVLQASRSSGIISFRPPSSLLNPSMKEQVVDDLSSDVIS